MIRILLVEDEVGIAFALEADLQTEGYEVKVTGNGDEALRFARTESFDLILLDMMLPGRDGFEVCRELRRGGSRTPIILLTAKAQEAEKVMGLELGADDYVTKPFSPRELRARIKAVLRRGAQEAPAETYRFDDTEVDFGRCEVRRAGTPVDLSALEFRLLTAFIRSRGRVLSRDQLLDAAWGQGVSLNDRVVDNHIVALRRKIEPDPGRPRFFLNIRGMGYRFDG
ncbi:MAG: response regulator transcription factor [Acidobacteria bacterium]|nr:response regulator transcription factor [Acidobacteriota bacterium]